jgi:5'-3' exonuclease
MGIVFLIVDGLNLIRRVYAANPEGEPSARFDSARGAAAQSLRRALAEHSPTHAVVVFDGAEPTWRHELYADYKAGRKPMPEELRAGLDRFQQAFSKLGVASVSKPGIEADDVVATLATGVAAHEGIAIVLSTDTAFCQLISERIVVRDHFQKRALDETYVRVKFGVGPEHLVDLWALAGSPTTHIPGVPGVGLKTAAKLLDEHGNLDAVLEAGPGIEGKLGEALRAGAELARLSRKLARLRTDLELGWNLRSFRVPA